MGATSFPTQARAGAPTLPREAAAAARLQLAESLLSTDDAPECAQAAVDWLGARGGARRAGCALFDAGTGELGRRLPSGVPRAPLEGMGLGLWETETLR